MLVFWKERLVFLAVPKTGTTSLHEALGPRASIVLRHQPGLKHTNLERYQRFIQPMLRSGDGGEFETFAIIREPISWLSSWYRYRQREEIMNHPKSTRGISFDDFVRHSMSPLTPAFADVGSQARFLLPRSGGPGVTHILPYEDPARIEAFLSDRLGPLAAPLARRNVSPAMETPLSAETESQLRMARAADFSLWEQAMGR